MTPRTPSVRSATTSAKRFFAPAALRAFAFLLLADLAPRSVAAELSASAGTGVISGIVTNNATGNGLIGATVEIPTLNLSVLVDRTGRYLLNVPAGSHELVVSYTGLDSQRATVEVASGP